jgi:hypothetical protein
MWLTQSGRYERFDGVLKWIPIATQIELMESVITNHLPPFFNGVEM